MKRRILFILLLLMVICLFSHAEAAGFQLFFSSAAPSSHLSVKHMPPDAISVYRSDERYYLLLPAGWDAKNLRVYYTGTKELYINNEFYAPGDTVSLTPGEKVQIKTKSGLSYTLRILQSENIPAIFITTQSGTIEALKPDKSVREPGLCTIVHADGSKAYDGALDYLRTRGNASFYYPKKSFQFKLDKSVSIDGMKSDKKWVLLSNYFDKSLIRNSLSFAIARYSRAYSFVPDSRPVDLYLNHSYYGSFLLIEKCEIDKNRLNITNLEKATEQLNSVPLDRFPTFGDRLYARNGKKGYQIEKNPQDITGGYLVLCNNRLYFASESSGFVTSRGQAFTIDQPKYASEAQINYLSEQFQLIEDALFQEDGVHPQTGLHWSSYLDKTTFLHRYLHAEITADFDGQEPYFFKDKDSADPLIYCAPVWDQDNIWGAMENFDHPRQFCIANDTSLPYLWFPQAMRHLDFQKEVIQLYQQTYAPALRILLGEETDPDGLLMSVDAYAEEIAASAAMDQIRWPIGANRATNFNPKTGNTPEANVTYVKNFIRKRMEFLDSQWMKSE